MVHRRADHPRPVRRRRAHRRRCRPLPKSNRPRAGQRKARYKPVPALSTCRTAPPHPRPRALAARAAICLHLPPMRCRTRRCRSDRLPGSRPSCGERIAKSRLANSDRASYVTISNLTPQKNGRGPALEISDGFYRLSDSSPHPCGRAARFLSAPAWPISGCFLPALLLAAGAAPSTRR